MFDGSLSSSIVTLSGGSDQQLFGSRNAPKHNYKCDECVPSLVTEQATSTPNAVAIVSGEETVTYAELESRSNRIAHFLRSLGAGPDVLVGLCLHRSVELIVSALAVLKSGGAYLPLDPAYPRERLAWMLNDAQPAVLLTQQLLANALPAGSWRTVNLDSDRQQVFCHTAHTIECSARPSNLAYVIYTSGSTGGRPKGVQIAHSSLLNLVLWHRQAFAISDADRASHLASPSFDAAVWEVWPYLTAGASVYLPDDGSRGGPAPLRDWLVSQGITVAFVPTPLAEPMLTLAWPCQIALRFLLTGADTLHSYPPSTLPFRLVNNYGPTECTVVATSGLVELSSQPEVPPSIGRPISNVQIYILDEQLRQVPVGVPGEIYIGGAALARGYLNAPELTAAKFIANPFDFEPNARMYRTGDLARQLPDGQIVFLGRLDEQIKIRGYRIEPNEIVTALAAHPMVQASIVVAQESIPGDKRLIAYIVPKSDAHLTDRELREFLSSYVPGYMVPSVFVRLESLPLNANGKIDRASLPPPDDSNSFLGTPYIAPRTPIEQRIAEILAPLLGVERVSVVDNFFMLGGHSLLGTQVIARTRDAFGIELSLRSLFQSPTVAALAVEVERLLYQRLEVMTDEEAEQYLKMQQETASGNV